MWGDFGGDFLTFSLERKKLGSGWGGGKTYRVNLGGGGTYCRVCSPKPLLEASEVGLVWSVPLSFKGNDRESPKRGGGNVSWVGGPKTFLGRGFSPNLRYVFHPPEFSTPLGRSLKKHRKIYSKVKSELGSFAAKIHTARILGPRLRGRT